MSATETIKDTLDAIEDTLDIIESTPPVVRSSYGWLAAGLVAVAAPVGLFIGYKIGCKRTALKYESILADEILKAKDFYARMYKREEFETPESTVEVLQEEGPWKHKEAFEKYQGKSEDGPDVEVTVNIFDREPAEVDFDIEVEKSKRLTSPHLPYVISKEEYFEGEKNYSQNVLTYFVNDDTLADETDQMIEDSDKVVGDDNLLRFGHGSGDNRIVYIRNDKMQLDFEVVKSNGSFAQEVLGFVQHSDRRGPRSFRRTDE